MDKNKFHNLFNKYLSGTLDEDERQELEAYMSSIDETVFSEMVDELIRIEENNAFAQEVVFQRVLDRIDEDSPMAKHKAKLFKRNFAQLGRVAAALLLVGLLGIVTYSIFVGKEREENFVSAYQPIEENEIELPREDALITLADGKQMSLDEIGADTIHYKGLEILRLGDGTIALKQNLATDFFQENEKHRFFAPKGVTLRLMLPDASVAYLNSNSSMQIYASFGKKQRQVELSGEAFFEVAHNKDLPFIVHAKNTEVTVLGTKFNMSAYREDKQVETTLLFGSVQVGAAQNQLRIKPGQQAIVYAANTIQLNESVDMGKVLAWRDGYFRFKDESIRTIMADLAKWYPIEDVEFKVGSTDTFTGSIRRSKKLKDVLKSIAEVSDLQFDIQEGRVVVMK